MGTPWEEGPFSLCMSKAADGIKVASHLTLKCGDYLGLSGCTQGNHMDP